MKDGRNWKVKELSSYEVEINLTIGISKGRISSVRSENGVDRFVIRLILTIRLPSWKNWIRKTKNLVILLQNFIILMPIIGYSLPFMEY
ncbi:hypothetical protein Avbf_04555 [Armadillidium vulgare]|nr:hypothetical protein Avbf_04555 [Armadillidium vulgare]